MEWIAVLIVFGLQYGSAYCTTSSAGSKFILGIPLGPEQRSTTFELIIATPNHEASYVIESSGEEISSGTTSSSQPATIELQRSYQVLSNDRAKGIQVRATGIISVLVIMKFGLNEYASFPVHVNSEILGQTSYEYFALSHETANHRSNFLLVGNFNSTTVSITPTQTVSLSELGLVFAGSTRQVTLNSLQTLLVFSFNDLTGTRIVSDKPLTVISGHQCAQFPTTQQFCEPVYVHIPPTITWGQNFFLAPFAGRNTNQHYKLTTSKSSTILAYRCGTENSQGMESSTAGSGIELTFVADSFCYLTASSPIFVVQLATGFFTDFIGDPAMAIVSPLVGHVSSSTFVSLPSSDFPESYITVTLQMEHFDEVAIRLDGNQLSCTWNAINRITSDNIVGYGCTTSVSAGPHVVSHSDENGVLSVTAYGWASAFAIGYAYLTGISLAVSSRTDVPVADQLPFFDLSSIPDLKELPREVDSHSPPIFIPGFLLIGNHVARTVYVNENGAFTFDDPWKFSHPNPYPTRNPATRLKHVISPFWSDNDIRKEGTVRYVTIERNSPSSDAVNLLNEVAAYVNDTFIDKEDEEFVPTWMIVGQWDEVHPHPHGAENHEGISEDFLNKWSDSGSEYAVVGYNSHGDYYENHPANGYEEIGDLVSCTNSGRNKRNADPQRNTFTENQIQVNPDLVQARQECEQIGNADDSNIPDINAIHNGAGEMIRVVDQLPKCPFSSSLALLSVGFLEFPVAGENCFHSVTTFVPNLRANATSSLQRTYTFVSVCCYNQNGALIQDDNGGGRITDLTPSQDNEIIDIGFRRNCCEEMVGCERYLRKRPLVEVEDVSTPCSSAWGDPHYASYDNARYTFAAEGEYYLTKVSSESEQLFHFQGRLGRRAWNASVTVAVAFGVPGFYGYQFVQNDQPVLLRTFPGPVEQLTSVDDDVVMITLSGNRCNVYFKILRIEIVMTWHSNYINYRICIPPPFCQVATGHLGNCDGNSANDIVRDTNAHRLIASETLFNYDTITGRKKRQTSDPGLECTSVDNCGDHTFVGVAFEDLEVTEEQREFCDGDESCIFDLVVTGDEEIAGTSHNASREDAEIQQMIRNFPPNITSSDGIFEVTVGEENFYTFTVTDSNNFTVSLSEGTPQGAVFLNEGDGRFSIRWTPDSTPTVALSFVAVDELGAATLHSPILQVCTCFNGGHCTVEGVPSTDQLLRHLTCVCTEAFDGDTCIEDKNGCSEIECFSGAECLDIPAPGVGAVCGSCPTGFTGDGVKCTDFDECMNSSLCDQVCVNTLGSYECSCNPGYQRVMDSNTCEDIDECTGVNACQQDCVNSQGSFQCSCEDGFMLEADGFTCTPLQPCASNPCSHICAVVGGQTRCYCLAGLQLADNSDSICEDINECDDFNPCDQVCTNTEGSFECSCTSGFDFKNVTQSCEDINECREAALAGTVICTENNTQCVNTPGDFECICVDGYELVQGECKRIVEVVPPVAALVPQIGENNTITYVVETFDTSEITLETLQVFRVATAMAITRFCASTQCVVASADGEQSHIGVRVAAQNVAIPVSLISNNSDSRPVLSFYVQLDNETFVSFSAIMLAIQEATDLYQDAGLFPDPCDFLPCMNGATCITNIEEYTCTCPTGFTGQNCSVNIDDCTESSCENGGTCEDEVNGFSCVCPAGYSGQLCSIDINECSDSPCENNGTCLDEVNSFSCLCAAGYTGSVCLVDINECMDSPCQNGGTCIDEVNAFLCLCVSGYTGHNCSVNIDDCRDNLCENGGTCTDELNSYRCICSDGFTGSNCSVDIDDCSSAPCENGGTCLDEVNRFQCICMVGYTGVNCSLNIDDCVDDPCDNGGTCTDEVDGFRCICAAGYTGTNCSISIDDCSSNPCTNNGTCLDELDDFRCECIAGYSGKNCSVDIDECAASPCENGGSCYDEVNDFRCECIAGYSGNNCSVDIDECASSPCENGGSCYDEVNDFRCECVAGYSGNNCSVDIDECAASPCENGGSCHDDVNGFRCVCKAGYTGRNCSMTVNDCSSSPCENGGTCMDGLEGFSCVCSSEFTGKLCESTGLSIGALAGSIAGGLLLFVLLAVALVMIMVTLIVVIVRKQRKQSKDDVVITNQNIEEVQCSSIVFD